MSEEHNTEQAVDDEGNSKPVNRRRFVKSLGAAGGATAFGAFGSGRVSGKSGSTPNVDMGILTGEKANNSIDTARKTSKFRTLRKQLIENYDQVTETDTVQVAKVNPQDGAQARIVSFKTSHSGPSNEVPNVRGNVAITLQSGSVTRASAVVRHLEDNKTKRITEFSVGDGTVEKQSIEGPELNNTPSRDASTVQPAKTIPDRAECTACKLVVQSACNLGCTLGVGAICGAAVVGGGLPGGLGCAAVATTVCTYLENTKNACSMPAERICTEIGYCNDDDPFV